MYLGDVSRRPRLDEVGEEPDARFSFANERTFLAWNRTALGCVVAGLAVSHVLRPDDDSSVGPKVAGVALMVLGALLAIFSYVNWASAQRALRLAPPAAALGAADGAVGRDRDRRRGHDRLHAGVSEPGDVDAAPMAATSAAGRPSQRASRTSATSSPGSGRRCRGVARARS